MSSTQHQLIEQCATRLRAIVEALDNIHDSTQHRSPHRWSTDLDDVHSSAESLLALIKDQAPTQASPKCSTCGGTGMVDDGEIDCYSDGTPFENGPVKCVKDCPACKAQPSPVQPEEAPVIGCLCGMPMTEGYHSPDGCSSLEEFAPHLSAQAQAEQAERPEVVGYLATAEHPKHGQPHKAFNYFKDQHDAQVAHWRERGCTVTEDQLMTVSQHAARVALWTDLFNRVQRERDAALARVAEFEAQAQHSAGYAEARQCVNCRHIGINDAADYAACHDCRWTGPEPDEDKCPGCAGENCMAAACPECGGRYELVAEANIATPVAQAGQVPQAWLDVQAERRRQVEAEGWTPEHDDQHSHGQMARAAACYALAGSSAPNDGTAALLVSLAWPWDQQWWKPTTPRRDLVKAGALVLAEIERIDRVAASQGGPSDA
ncbi:hypothetical protein ACJJBP_22810 [Pseudomonas aeruginosa]|uniref:hypothetical protein n=1 Tax=Pseudomonas aeruginosa TaxID=287 RepID=UPI0021BC1679|nr:hypothetical protein [Pseudomonas aeruginosa]MDQ2298603.1 hypothetical protein [Pseudomonas aeruginosa]WIK57009.1 hypothetical protein OI903_14835 [Pseudomonas aeruginosa]